MTYCSECKHTNYGKEEYCKVSNKEVDLRKGKSDDYRDYCCNAK